VEYKEMTEHKRSLPDDGGSQGERSILLRLSADEFRRLSYVADALQLSASATLRALIPNIERPDRQVVSTPADIASAAGFDVVPVAEDFDARRLRRLLADLRAENAALRLCDEIEQQLCERGLRTLRVDTYKRLGRWCHPHRWTDREKRVRPLAEELSRLLFGCVIERFG
jgi:hypothetical protein